MFLAPRMIPYFHAVWGLRRSEEKRRLTRHAQAIARSLRKEWEMSTSELRDGSGVKDRKAFTRALDELQAAMIVIPSEVFYQPKFTYIWTLGVSRFPDALRRRVRRDAAVREIARCVSCRRRNDLSRRAGPRDGALEARSRTRQPGARCRGLRDHARAGVVSAGSARAYRSSRRPEPRITRTTRIACMRWLPVSQT